MRIRVLSDLHLEFHRTPAALPSVGEDLLVLAGDIAKGVEGIRWARKACPDRPIVYVMGNHEFYGEDFEDLIQEARKTAQQCNVWFLEDEMVAFNGLRILGCTLWTDFRLYGANLEAHAMEVAGNAMADYRAIRSREGDPYTQRLMPAQTRDRFLRSARWLKRTLSSSPLPALVVTHHAPTSATAHPAFAGSALNAAFYSRLESLIATPVVAWIHGHSHHAAQVQVNNIPVVCNPRGYPGEDVPGFGWDQILTIEVPCES